MLELGQDWVWDAWYATDPTSSDERFHVFFLHAPRALGDPELRHENARVGHAVSSDLTTWSRLGDPLPDGGLHGFDDATTWTGSVVRGDDGRWRMFLTGRTDGDGRAVQRVGVAVSDDLTTWDYESVLVEADPRWYAVRGDGVPETHWRDPWVVRDDDGLWHMYVTARAADTTSAVIGHAVSTDLDTWQVTAPLSAPSTRFGWTEVLTLHCVEGRWLLSFSCLDDQIHDGSPGGCWVIEVDGPGAMVDLDAAVRLTTGDLYVAKLVQAPLGWRALAFINRDEHGDFAGVLTDPLQVGFDASGVLTLLDAPAAWTPDRPAHAGVSITSDRPARSCR